MHKRYSLFARSEFYVSRDIMASVFIRNEFPTDQLTRWFIYTLFTQLIHDVSLYFPL